MKPARGARAAAGALLFSTFKRVICESAFMSVCLSLWTGARLLRSRTGVEFWIRLMCLSIIWSGCGGATQRSTTLCYGCGCRPTSNISSA